MSGSVTTDASQHTNSDDRVLEIPNRCDDATLIEQWRSALPGPTKRVIRTTFETSGKEVVYVPAAYSSQPCSRCGHIDAKNRNGRDFLCMDCAHVDDADENEACNIRQRTIEILTLRTAGHNPTKTLSLLWKDIRANAKRYAKNVKGVALKLTEVV